MPFAIVGWIHRNCIRHSMFFCVQPAHCAMRRTKDVIDIGTGNTTSLQFKENNKNHIFPNNQSATESAGWPVVHSLFRFVCLNNLNWHLNVHCRRRVNCSHNKMVFFFPIVLRAMCSMVSWILISYLYRLQIGTICFFPISLSLIL